MVGNKAGKRSAPSCGECYRRKQKCSRQWPCNHCQARKIPHLCKFPQKDTPKVQKVWLDRARTQSIDGEIGINPDHEDDSTEPQSLPTTDKLRVLGYLPGDRDSLLEKATLPPNGTKTTQALDALSPEMQNVLRLLPPKPYTDILTQKFLQIGNFNYCSLYPPIFSADYAAWWADRTSSKAITPEFTCLVIRVCACSAQYMDAEGARKLESELGDSIQSLSENFHNAARQLSNTIGPGKGGFAQVQQLFLTAVWFKSEALFVESWHALGSCIHEAQEQGMHKRVGKSGLSEFDTEMRRRMWCLLYNWDWQMAMLLSRPLMINQSLYTIELPNVQLDDTNVDGPPSPVAHTAAQCQLGQMITKTSLLTGATTTQTERVAIQSYISDWLASLPPAYRETDPDTRWDEEHTYVRLQRHQTHAIAYMTMLPLFKPFLTKSLDFKSTQEDRDNRATAVNIALHLMSVTHRLFDHVFPTNSKFHIVSFLVFDTAAFLCSAVIHDKDDSLPRREEVLQAIGLACFLAEKLSHTSKTGAVCYPILVKLAGSMRSPKTSPLATGSDLPAETMHYLGPSSVSDTSPPTDMVSPDSWLSSLDSLSSTESILPTPLENSIPEIDLPPSFSMGDLSQMDMGQFDQIWDWNDLDLGFFPYMQT